MKLISWNLLRLVGASLSEVVDLIEREQPDILLMQEATHDIDPLPQRVGGGYHRIPLPGRVHGLAVWMPHALPNEPVSMPLPSGTMVHRVAQIIDLGGFTIANVHLSHGQILNRRQLRRIAARLPHNAAVIGDYNLVGPVLLPGFRDVGPRRATHRMSDVLPLRLDRCVVRGMHCEGAAVLPRGASDHRPITMRLSVAEASEVRKHQPHARIA
ncbi:endonuclease/exonuclease/phosphatase family protein [Acidisphaera sp. L21]|uniref:endonuclease/exonuclease/phosphatase family protein n=1 Tax=Acidisphaera sp. L21 TaxID=1641851 RepID=UPI00131CDAFF|nr:endonuclease/exonuclease/phosphatase family protein [Acidisphaera sp. L21]